MEPVNKVVAIVDPYDAGVLLGPACRDRGAAAILVRSDEELLAALDLSAFSATVDHRGNVAETTAQLKAHGVDRVIAGSEDGVNLADELSEALGVPSNGTRLSAARRHKSKMHSAVAAAGLRVPAHMQSATLDPILDWIRQRARWPVVLKPPHASSSDGIRLCASEAEVTAAFQELIGKTNVLDLVNETVIAQEYITGEEYVVDTVSWEGRHYPAAFWRYGKPAPAYSTVGLWTTKDLLPAEGPVQDRLFGYVCGVLDALDIRYGPAHCEVKLDDDGPVLIEVGARLHGGPKAHQTCRAAFGSSQLDLTVEAYLDSARFLQRQGQRYRLEKTAVMVMLRPERTGILREMPKSRKIEGLASLHELLWFVRPHCAVPAVGGLVILIHQDRNVVDGDLDFIRNLQVNGLFQFEDHL
jgi:biotin carboxylase